MVLGVPILKHFRVNGKTGKEVHGEFANNYGSSASSYAQVKFWVVDSNAVERL